MDKVNQAYGIAMSSRHIDSGYSLTHYAKQSIVRCIECDTIGEIENRYESIDGGRNMWCATFTCKHCQLSLIKDDCQQDWVGPCRLVGHCRCHYCGTHLSVEQDRPTHQYTLPTYLIRNCSACGLTNNIPVERDNKFLYYEASLAIDPDFGLALFLQKPCRFGKIWAFNQTHLTELHTYINASLRESSVEAGNASMASRLPHWMKSAKNREMINKKLTQLQMQLTAHQNKPMSKN